jgi:hypothetical protein
MTGLELEAFLLLLTLVPFIFMDCAMAGLQKTCQWTESEGCHVSIGKKILTEFSSFYPEIFIGRMYGTILEFQMPRLFSIHLLYTPLRYPHCATDVFNTDDDAAKSLLNMHHIVPKTRMTPHSSY